MVDNRVVRWVRRGNKIHLEDVAFTRLGAEHAHLQRGVESASLRTVIRAFDIITRARRRPVIDITGTVRHEVRKASALEFMQHFKHGPVDPKRSSSNRQGIPANVDIRFYQTWVPMAVDCASRWRTTKSA